MEQKIRIYTLTSELHDEKAVGAVTKEFLEGLGLTYELRGTDYSDYGGSGLHIIYVRTGGTEGIFLKLLPQLLEKSSRPFYLLTSGKSNSLAASMEILKGEIIHGSQQYITRRITMLAKVEEACRQLNGIRLGIIGEPSDWLISSHADKAQVKARLGIDLIDIPMQELLQTVAMETLRISIRH